MVQKSAGAVQIEIWNLDKRQRLYILYSKIAGESS